MKKNIVMDENALQVLRHAITTLQKISEDLGNIIQVAKDLNSKDLSKDLFLVINAENLNDPQLKSALGRLVPENK